MSFKRLIATNDSLATEPVDANSPVDQRKPVLTDSLDNLYGINHFFAGFIKAYPHLQGVEFVEQILEHFNFSFQTPWKERENIPAEGRVIIISNHPLGTLDALALYKLVSDVRPDVKVVIEGDQSLPKAIKSSPLAHLILPYKPHTDLSSDSCLNENNPVVDYLAEEGALIIFPCQDMSRIRPTGVSDPKWRFDFLQLALSTQSPILPLFIDAKNSALFYGLSAIYKPLSSLIVVPEMYKQTRKSVSIRVGGLIANDTFKQSGLPLKTQVKLFKKHVYKIGKGKQGIWPSQTAVAHPEPRKALKQLISSQLHLGKTSDGKQIYLYQHSGSSAALREIGRLREISFRAVGEGTGKRRDIDQYDAVYSQLVLWDEQDLEIVGAYRLAAARDIINNNGVHGLYSASLFDYEESILPILEKGAELGRSFVQPKYWGKRSLDYLWYGIGSFLGQNPDIRYLFGPVSLSNDMPKAAKDLMVYFFTLYFGQLKHQDDFLKASGCIAESSVNKANITPLARSKTPYRLSSDLINHLKIQFLGDDYKQDFKTLKHIMSNMGCSIPTLFKQYSELCDPGGLIFLDFGIDTGFGDCIDGLVMVDVTKIKQKKRARYMPDGLLEG
ncbi:lysophospholipid acyltransferase family protein [Alkalimarinus alittae]|uniref:L-ornithine N(alpha)-acyltransferase n=1 Tax=Alkalimarinus alittae TaxID=2961619 RepID=A0ABY6MXJ0_9ALTE|nr:lysophospholipid acyltransferase family protein [Alkalimarinus alittae]UZE94546.1 lysophospholipid acyltransferase family protein [Alkalimarinus alittae]